MFGKLQRTAEMNSDGLGLGLRICKQLVEQNGGTIKANSDGINMGSSFTFSMKMEGCDTEDENSKIAFRIDSEQHLESSNDSSDREVE